MRKKPPSDSKCDTCGRMFTKQGLYRHHKHCGRITAAALVKELNDNPFATLSSLGSMTGSSTAVIREYLDGTEWDRDRLKARGLEVSQIKRKESSDERRERTREKREKLRTRGLKKCPVCELLIEVKREVCIYCEEEGKTLEDVPPWNIYLLVEDGIDDLGGRGGGARMLYRKRDKSEVLST